MWLLLTRQGKPDVPVWSGRRLLAAVDAIAWPLFWVLVIRHATQPVGLVGPIVAAFAMSLGLVRLRRAVFMNHRYRFATWRWCKVAAAMLVIGFLLKLSMTT
ncbi:hypothetical protein [Aquincola sp. J276]|uniref:hypothetical protein n=1 Tax=Aquincola sp. J276 TaxID=2898432 RepID=UPI002150A8CD|nr:hypothetical protein [Aquincola sp. J276]MCR5867573.1 hypothetical protein [Aquincola sp. J276]